jgi:2-keto-3-deoxy-L-rhamnonate aldolase RhmA
LNSPSLAELVVNGTELDFVAVELQHAQVSSGESTAILRAVQAADPDVTPLVRLPDHSVYWIQQSLDAGFTGMIVPLVESAEQAESLVRAAYFPPLGDRSSAGSIRAVMYAIEPDTANARMLLLPQIESARGLEQVEAIVAVDGVSGALVGPEDLSLSCGWRGKDLWSYEPFLEAVERVLAACRRHGKVAAVLSGAFNDAQKAGFDIIGFAGDQNLVRVNMVANVNDCVAQLREGRAAQGGETAPGALSGHRQRVDAYRSCLQRFDRWIERHLREGNEGWKTTETSADGYFALSVYGVHCGRPDWTQRALGHVEQKFIDGDGCLRQQAKRDQMIAYVPSWLAWAALKAERFQLSRPLLDFIGGLQDPSSGGFFAGTDERDSQSGAIDLDSTTMSILALAQGGRTEAAARGGDYLLNLCRVQPEPERQFCTGWSEPEGLRTSADQVAATTILQWDQPQQHYYKVGLIVEALVHVHGATGNSDCLDAAVTLYNDTVIRATDLWTNTFSHKMCWAATTLHAVTGEAGYLEHACRFADHIVGLQQPDDAFTYPEIWPSYPPEPWESLANIGPQFALWIVRTLRAVEGVGVTAEASQPDR